MSRATPTAWRRKLGVALVAIVSAGAGLALGRLGRDEANPAPVIGAAGSDLARDHGSGDALPFVTDAASCDSFKGEPVVVDLEALERALMNGADSERLDALETALEAGVDLPADLLRRTYTTDPADDVRLLALMTWTDSVADDAVAVRDGLQDAAYDRNPAVRAEARHRLDELDRFLIMQGEIAAQAPN